MLKRWKQISKKLISRNDHWSYYLDQFEIDQKGQGEYHYVHTGGSSMIIPVTPSKNILLVNQYRYLNQEESLEFPCGAIESNLSAKKNAIKELREETGYDCKTLNFIGEFSPFSGVCDEMCSVFIADQLFKNSLLPDMTEEFELIELSMNEIEEKIENGLIWDGMTMAAWIMAKPILIKEHIL